MARNVGDLALLLSVIAGPDRRTPFALGDPGRRFAPPVTGTLGGLRVALSVDLGGAFEVDDEVAAVVSAAATTFAAPAPRWRSATPTCRPPTTSSAPCAPGSSRRRSATSSRSTPTRSRPSLADNIRAGEGVTGADVARAFEQRTAVMGTARDFFSTYDVLVLPVSQVPPFPADQEYPHAINGRPQETYLDWMRSAYLVTVTGCPAISVPAGTTTDGLPVGIQIVAPHGADRALLEVAAAFEAARGCRLIVRGAVVVHRLWLNLWTGRTFAVQNLRRVCGGHAGTRRMFAKPLARPGGFRHRTSPTHSLRGERDRSETKVRTDASQLAWGLPRQLGDEAAGAGVDERSTGSVTSTGRRRALVTHTHEGPSACPLQCCCPCSVPRRRRSLPGPRPARPTPGRRASLVTSARQLIHRTGPDPVDGSASPVERPGGFCGRHADRREFPEIVGESPCAGG